MAIIELTTESFEKKVLKSQLPILVDFYADWCPPCKAIAPILEDLEKEFAGRMRIGRLDIEKNPELTVKYGVMSIPMLLIFWNGKMVGGRAGATDEATLRAEIEVILKKITSEAKEKMPKFDHVEL